MLRIDCRGHDTLINYLKGYRAWINAGALTGNCQIPRVIDDASGWPCFFYDDIQGINACAHDKIVIDCSWEGLHSIGCFLEYDPNKYYLFFSSGYWNVEQQPMPFKYDVVFTYFYIFECLNRITNYQRIDYHCDHEYDFDQPKSLVMISTTGNVRPDRDYLKEKIQDLEFNNFVFRYSGQDHGLPSKSLDIVNFKSGSFDPYISLSDEFFFTVSHTIPIDLYNSARFNLVVESDIALQNNFFLTEKTLKCLITGMPFVTVSTSGFLDHLRGLGFQTYSSLWDESYDDLTDYRARIDKIIELCNTLARRDWDSMRDELEMIKLRNRSWFLSSHLLMDRIYKNLEKVALKHER